MSTPRGFDADAIAGAVVASLPPGLGPDPFETAARHTHSEELAGFAKSAAEAWRAVGVARTDAEHGVVSEDEMFQPLSAIQWYETQVGNFEQEARKLLAGRS